MKTLLTLVGSLMISCAIAQDGSNIRYYKPSDLDGSLIGKYCHIDVGRTSFGGYLIDTVEINVQGQPMTFYEHRKDDGFGNWFKEQYLIRIEDNAPLSTYLKSSKIDSLSSDKIYVTSVLSYYVDEAPIDTITVFQHYYEKKNVAKVLIKR